MQKTTLIILAAGLVFLVLCGELSAQTRIRFARGRTSTTISGQIGGEAGRTYVLGARRGQVLSGNISSPGECVKFASGSTSTSFVTEAGENYLRITNDCRRGKSFTMTVSINYGSD